MTSSDEPTAESRPPAANSASETASSLRLPNMSPSRPAIGVEIEAVRK